MPGARASIVSAATAWLARLRFPVLFVLVLVLFLVDLVVPDALPFVDEILLGLLVAILGRWRSRRAERGEADAQARAERGASRRP